MQITSLRIKNFLSISDVELKPGKINQIVGANNQGKTSVIKALEIALTGSSDGSLVKKGETAAEIIVEFDDLVVHRKIRADGKNDVSVRKGDFKTSSPQSLLNSFFDANAFNPLELLSVKAREDAILKAVEVQVTREELLEEMKQLEVDRYMPDIDYSKHGIKVVEEVGKYFYQRRTEANKTAQTAKKWFEFKKSELPEEPQPDGLPLQDHELDVEIQKLTDQITARYKATQKVQEERGDYNRIQSLRAEMIAEIGKLHARIEELKAHELRLGDEAEQKMRWIEENTFNVEKAEADQKQIADLTAAKTTRAAIKNHKQQAATVAEYEKAALEAQAEADRLDSAVTFLRKVLPNRVMNRIQMPVPGLSYENGEFLLDGVKVENLSTSASMRLAVALARKLGAKTKLICLDGAEALDSGSWKQLMELIKDDGYTYFVTKVGEQFSSDSDDETVVLMQQGQATILREPDSHAAH